MLLENETSWYTRIRGRTNDVINLIAVALQKQAVAYIIIATEPMMYESNYSVCPMQVGNYKTIKENF